MLTREMRSGEVLYEDGVPFTHAVFPHEGVLSLMAEEDGGRSVEKATIGLEGFLGFVLLLDGGTSVSRSVVSVPGYASWLSTRDLDEALQQFECVRQVMLLYAKYLIRQLMESVACNVLHTAEQRTSRWLLHTADRVSHDNIEVTQQTIAYALGLRRATVNEVLSKLRSIGAIDYSRGHFTVVDKTSLERHACSCYHRIRRNSMWQKFEPI